MVGKFMSIVEINVSIEPTTKNSKIRIERFMVEENLNRDC